MKTLMPLLLMLAALPVAGQTTSPSHDSSMHSGTTHLPATQQKERLGTVSFHVSCAPSTQASFNRGVALLHDFWYGEAQLQFEQILKRDPTCVMAHWGIAMSVFHQIWDRPNAATMKLGWAQMQAAQSPAAHTARERAYIAALTDFYRPGPEKYQARVDVYSAAMGALYARYPKDVDAGAFYALSLLASISPNDTSLSHNRKAMVVLAPLFAMDPNNPGVDHYIIHSCDNPAMATEGLAAANHYGQIAQSGPHAAHMPGHIYARLGMWPQDIAAQLDSIKASQVAEARGEPGILDEPHSYDFLIYAYLQSGQDARAKAALDRSAAVLTKIASMSGSGAAHMAGMVPYYRNELPGFYDLGMNDWKAAAALEPVSGSPPADAALVYWVRAVADGHLRRAESARADLARYDELMTEVKKGAHGYYAEGTEATIERDEVVAWTGFAEGHERDAVNTMRSAADLEDKVGQREVDIPAREMLGDMLLASGQPRQALAEYQISLKLSPNRLDELYNAGRAAEEAGNKAKAEFYYAALLKSTADGVNSTRPAFDHARSFLSSAQRVAK